MSAALWGQADTETANEYFLYGASAKARHGRWNIYGIDLPDEILQRVYAQNALRLFGLADVSDSGR